MEQNVLTRLDNRRGGTRIEMGLNGGRRASVPLSLDDPARELATAIDTVLRITLRGPEDFSLPLFIGRVLIPEQASEDGGADLTLQAADPFFQLERSMIWVVNSGVLEARTFSATDQSEIMWALIEAIESTSHGVVEGDLAEASISRDRTYPPTKEVGPALVEMSEVIGGPDFELEPVLGEGTTTLARFNTYYPRQGEDKSESARFTFGAFPHSAVGLAYSPGGEEIVNRVVAIGAPREQAGELPFSEHPGYIAEHAESVEEFGLFERRLPLEDVTESATLESHAKGAVAAGAFPIPYFDLTNAPEQADTEPVGSDGVPPRFGIDYWIGDTIGVDAYMDGPDSDPLELTGRVTDAVVTERDSGQLEVKLTCAPEVESEGVTGLAVTIRVPEGVEE